MNTILLIILLVLLFGGGGFYAHNNLGPHYGYGLGGIGGIILLLVILRLAGLI